MNGVHFNILLRPGSKSYMNSSPLYFNDLFTSNNRCIQNWCIKTLLQRTQLTSINANNVHLSSLLHQHHVGRVGVNSYITGRDVSHASTLHITLNYIRRKDKVHTRTYCCVIWRSVTSCMAFDSSSWLTSAWHCSAGALWGAWEWHLSVCALRKYHPWCGYCLTRWHYTSHGLSAFY